MNTENGATSDSQDATSPLSPQTLSNLPTAETPHTSHQPSSAFSSDRASDSTKPTTTTSQRKIEAKRRNGERSTAPKTVGEAVTPGPTIARKPRHRSSTSYSAVDPTESSAIQLATIDNPNAKEIVTELIEDSGVPGRLKSLVWQGGKDITLEVPENRRALSDFQCDESLLRNIRFPKLLALKTRDAVSLFKNISTLISEYLDIDERSNYMVVWFVLSTWFPDQLMTAPYLLINGPFGSGKTTLLRLLSCLCRRGMLLSDLTTSELCSLPMMLRPTLLIDETQLSEDLCRLLRAGQSRGVPVIRKGCAIDVYGPKAIATRDPLRDNALASRCLSISMAPSMQKVPLLDSAAMSRIADEFQPQLLRFKLDSKIVRISTNEQKFFTPRLRDIAEPLLSLIGGDEDLAERVRNALRDQDWDTYSAREVEPTALVFTALYRYAHEVNFYGSVGKIAELAEQLAISYGEPYRLHPRAVGHYLRILGFQTVKFGRVGRGVPLTREVRKKLHKLTSSYQVAFEQVPTYEECTICSADDR